MNPLTRPIFIVGAPRSGTTLLQYILRSHPTFVSRQENLILLFHCFVM
jgi:hypothetical protein